jgi:hypothetical protein
MLAVRPALSALLAIVALGAVGCGEDKSASTTVTTIQNVTNPTGTFSVTTHGRYHYPPGIINSYMKGCTKGLQQREAFCGCTLNKLSNTVSVRDFARLGKVGRPSPRMQRLFKRAGDACKNKL